MCFNISIVSTQAIIEKQFDAEFHIDFTFEPKPHISAFANPEIPIITAENPKTIEPFNWGLIPHWVKDKNRAEEIRRMTYNAKSETVKEKPSFRDAYNNRCLVIANGFYEWQQTPSGKVCHFINANKSEIFTFAGIYSQWINPINGKITPTISILTQPANEMMAKIHNIKKRQPVILSKENQSNWLEKTTTFREILDSSHNIKLNSVVVDSPLKRN